MTDIERRLADRIRKLEDRFNALESIPQTSNIATLDDIILIVNKITNSLKRKR